MVVSRLEKDGIHNSLAFVLTNHIVRSLATGRSCHNLHREYVPTWKESSDMDTLVAAMHACHGKGADWAAKVETEEEEEEEEKKEEGGGGEAEEEEEEKEEGGRSRGRGGGGETLIIDISGGALPGGDDDGGHTHVPYPDEVDRDQDCHCIMEGSRRQAARSMINSSATAGC
ncbi:hypothetical protein CBR_g41147 [Chara braunii]|uniref:Uncharacterized protein n=1 Tax=Chara braunii TaxID=69332 RepID=A0A388K2F7_CHABU|nr:hypothetical protein CBR_g41147 [Chara braunii]|eukprot:GBG64226.1 hypothetical protein CBR_g41147 [Chara braunii]